MELFRFDIHWEDHSLLPSVYQTILFSAVNPKCLARVVHLFKRKKMLNVAPFHTKIQFVRAMTTTPASYFKNFIYNNQVPQRQSRAKNRNKYVCITHTHRRFFTSATVWCLCLDYWHFFLLSFQRRRQRELEIESVIKRRLARRWKKLNFKIVFYLFVGSYNSTSPFFLLFYYFFSIEKEWVCVLTIWYRERYHLYICE